VDEVEADLLPEDRLKPKQLQSIQLIAFIYALDFLFCEGTRAATMAVAEFEKLGMSGFKIGSAVFEGENENVMRGRDLSEALKRALANTSVLELIKSENAIKSLTLRMIRLARNGAFVD